MLSQKGTLGKWLTHYKYRKVIQVIGGDDNLVCKSVVEYFILSIESKRVCVDIRSLVIFPTLTEPAYNN